MAVAIARHRATGTDYVSLVVGHGNRATVWTATGSRYDVDLAHVDLLPGAIVSGPA